MSSQPLHQQVRVTLADISDHGFYVLGFPALDEREGGRRA